MITSLGLLWAIQKIRIHNSNPAQAAQTHGSDYWLIGLHAVSLGSLSNFFDSAAQIVGLLDLRLGSLDYASRITGL